LSQVPFTFSALELCRFIALHLITAPPNYRWQELLEHYFPARENTSPHGYKPIPLRDRNADKDRDSNAGDTANDDDDDEDNDDHAEDEDLEEQSSRRRRQKQKRGKLNLRNTAIKWFIDCITVGAIINTLAFLIIMGLLKLQGPATIWQNIKDRTIKIIVDGYKLWPIASVISFSFVPVERRIVFFSFVGLCWNVYLSLVAARL
jgi:hypothetical protein